MHFKLVLIKQIPPQNKKMDNNIDAFKAKLNESKTEIGKKELHYISLNINTEIDILYSSIIKKIAHNGIIIDSELIAEINNAILESKKEFERDWISHMNSLGIKI